MYLQSIKSVEHNAAKSVSNFLEKQTYKVCCLYSSFVHAYQTGVRKLSRVPLWGVNRVFHTIPRANSSPSRPNSLTKSRQSFPPCYSQSPLQDCLEISISSNSRRLCHLSSNSHNLLHISTVELRYTVNEQGRKPDINPYPLPYALRIHTETSSLGTLKIMSRKLNEIVRS